MDSWQRFDEKLLSNKKYFYSNLNIEEFTNVDYRHAKKVFKRLNNENLGNYHDLDVQSDTLLLADVVKNITNECIEIMNLILLIFYLQED